MVFKYNISTLGLDPGVTHPSSILDPLIIPIFSENLRFLPWKVIMLSPARKKNVFIINDVTSD